MSCEIDVLNVAKFLNIFTARINKHVLYRVLAIKARAARDKRRTKTEGTILQKICFQRSSATCIFPGTITHITAQSIGTLWDIVVEPLTDLFCVHTEILWNFVSQLSQKWNQQHKLSTTRTHTNAHTHNAYSTYITHVDTHTQHTPQTKQT